MYMAERRDLKPTLKQHWNKRSLTGKVDYDKCAIGQCKNLKKNIVVKRIRLKVISEMALLALFSFYFYLYRICLNPLYHFMRALRVCPAWSCWRRYHCKVALAISFIPLICGYSVSLDTKHHKSFNHGQTHNISLAYLRFYGRCIRADYPFFTLHFRIYSLRRVRSK